MKALETYLKCLATLAVLLAALGLAGPWLISARSDEAVLLGFSLLTLTLPGTIYLIWRREITSLTKPFKENDKA